MTVAEFGTSINKCISAYVESNKGGNIAEIVGVLELEKLNVVRMIENQVGRAEKAVADKEEEVPVKTKVK